MNFPKPTREAKVRKPLKRGGRRGKQTSKRRKERLELKKQAEILWARWIKRDGLCEFRGHGGHHYCRGQLQAMHGFGRKAYPAVRFSAWNGFCGCAAIHSYFTWRSPEWENFLRGRWGEAKYQERLRLAMTVAKPDLAKVVETYTALLAGAPLPEAWRGGWR